MPLLQSVPAPVASWPAFIWTMIAGLFGATVLTTFVALSVVDRIIVRRLKSADNSDSVDGLVIGAIQRREAELATLVQRIMRSQVEDLNRKSDVAEVNKDRLDAVEKIQDLTITRVTRLETETRDMPRMVDALERVERAMETIAKSVTETRDIVHTLKGEWDGHKRRSTDR